MCLRVIKLAQKYHRLLCVANFNSTILLEGESLIE
jgi:hypothetical protein